MDRDAMTGKNKKRVSQWSNKYGKKGLVNLQMTRGLFLRTVKTNHWVLGANKNNVKCLHKKYRNIGNNTDK